MNMLTQAQTKKITEISDIIRNYRYSGEQIFVPEVNGNIIIVQYVGGVNTETALCLEGDDLHLNVTLYGEETRSTKLGKFYQYWVTMVLSELTRHGDVDRTFTSVRHFLNAAKCGVIQEDLAALSG